MNILKTKVTLFSFISFSFTTLTIQPLVGTTNISKSEKRLQKRRKKEQKKM